MNTFPNPWFFKKENAANLLIRAKNKQLQKIGRLTIKKSFKHVHPSKQLPLCTIGIEYSCITNNIWSEKSFFQTLILEVV